MDNIVNNFVKQAGTNALENAVISNVQQQIGGALGGSNNNSNSNSNSNNNNNNSNNNNNNNNSNSGNVSTQDKYIAQGVDYLRKNAFGDKDITAADQQQDQQIASFIGSAINNYKK